MGAQDSVEIFERAAKARGRILRVEADRADALPRILALTFDIGRVLVQPVEGEIRAEAVPDRTALPQGLVSLEEEDPWWRVLGQPLTAVRPLAAGSEPVRREAALGGLELRFREPDENPRVVRLATAGPALRVTLDATGRSS